ncbi:MAG: YbfB/YjiJ family MFS transporter [Rhizobacter sp.]
MTPTTAPSAPRVALAGLLSLAVAMGIGRFAFTPLLPVMLGEHAVDLTGASWLATANYIGYLIGALLCTAQPTLWARWQRPPIDAARCVRGGLVATALLTAGMALPVPALWPTLRFLAGVASAVVFVYTSGWCLGRLSGLGKPAMGGVIYAGPGVGIAASGLLVGAVMGVGGSAPIGWVVFGVLAAALTLTVWPTVRGAAHTSAATSAAPGPFTAEKGWFVLAYGLSGFGYIITATFLPVIARETLPPTAWLNYFWPLLGFGVVVGALLATRVPRRIDFRDALAVCFIVQAVGVVIGVWVPGVASFALGSLLVGLPFTAISFFGMQEARRLSPAAPAGLMGLSTAVYGVGQIAGPPIAAWLIAHSGTRAQGFAWALEAAAASLVVGAVIHLVLARAHPRPAAQ